MPPGRPRKVRSEETDAKIPYQTGLIKREMTQEEARKYGVTLYDGKVDTLKLTQVEWFSNDIPSKDPTIGFAKSGHVNIGKEASALMNLTDEDRLEFGFLASPKRVFIRKSPQGLLIKRLQGGKIGSGFRCSSNKVIKWMITKKIEMKRHLLQATDDPNIFIVDLK